MHFREGEIVGLAGLVGSGKSEIMRACFGLEAIKSGRLIFNGKTLTRVTPSKMLDLGMFYIPPDRRIEGLVMVRNVRENITLAALASKKLSNYSIFLKRNNENKMALDLSSSLNLHPMRTERRVDLFSGGNQQKALLAKVLTRKTKLFVFDEPTVGVDVGTRAAIYEFIKDLCQQGAAIALISSDLPEILNLTHRTYVFHRGTCWRSLKGRKSPSKTYSTTFLNRTRLDHERKRYRQTRKHADQADQEDLHRHGGASLSHPYRHHYFRDPLG